VCNSYTSKYIFIYKGVRKHTCKVVRVRKREREREREKGREKEREPRQKKREGERKGEKPVEELGRSHHRQH